MKYGVLENIRKWNAPIPFYMVSPQIKFPNTCTCTRVWLFYMLKNTVLQRMWHCVDNYEEIIGTQNFVFFCKITVENHSVEIYQHEWCAVFYALTEKVGKYFSLFVFTLIPKTTIHLQYYEDQSTIFTQCYAAVFLRFSLDRWDLDGFKKWTWHSITSVPASQHGYRGKQFACLHPVYQLNYHLLFQFFI
jgi:hypothetical protein